jgi:hypothetical protein
MNFDTEFKKNLIDKLKLKKYGKSKNKSLSDSSINLYIRNLEKLNNDNPLKNFNFLKDTETIIKQLSEYKENTKRGYLISICSCLSTDKDNKQKEKLYSEYYKLLNEKNNTLKELEKENKLSNTQSTNWIEWKDVEKKYNELKEKINKITSYKEINEHTYNVLLQYVILSLYYLLPPRRNQDYYKMVLIKSYKPDMDINTNYLDYDKKEFIFNVYKTSKKEGSQIEKIPEELEKVIDIYLKYHPLIKNKKIKNKDIFPFLVYYNGEAFSSVNCITRILNKIFDKAIGSSMLRHSYLSHKYGDVLKEQKRDSELMGHSLSQQKDYIKIKK